MECSTDTFDTIALLAGIGAILFAVVVIVFSLVERARHRGRHRGP